MGPHARHEGEWHGTALRPHNSTTNTRVREQAHTYRGRETDESARRAVRVDVGTACIRILADQTNVLICGVGVAVKDIPSRGGGQVRYPRLGASLGSREARGA